MSRVNSSSSRSKSSSTSAVASKLKEKGICEWAEVSSQSRNVINSDQGEIFTKFGTGGVQTGPKMEQFLKYEALGLECLSQAISQSQGSELLVPRPFLVDSIGDSAHFIAMQRLNFAGARGKGIEQRFGVALAKMHQVPILPFRGHATYGFPMDGCCGAAEQLNNEEGRDISWVEFWREYRLESQLKMIKESSPGDKEIQELGAQLSKKLDEFFMNKPVEDIQASALHGDLWSGNWGVAKHDKSGESVPYILDPAAYIGSPEADLGMLEFMGGVGPDFFNAYFSVMPKEEGFEQRLKIYELHHHMNHYTIFGAGYRPGCISIMRSLLKASR